MVNPTEEKVHKTRLLRTVINTCLLTNDKNVHAIINYSRMGIRDRALLYCSLYIREVGPQIKLQRTLKSCFQTFLFLLQDNSSVFPQNYCTLILLLKVLCINQLID